MKTIYKYPIPIKHFFNLELPRDAKILSFQTQLGIPVIWALINPENELIKRDFCIRGTGEPDYSEDRHIRTYLGTIQTGALVWHLFEEVK
ncbi:unnamed protein product [marine sediment metagenome]|uniref:DUF7352 domain-containing protein n=1 Tax=marine sediment metagenome TaxID=412755 RepID=X0SMV3_9ZZZZ